MQHYTYKLLVNKCIEHIEQAACVLCVCKQTHFLLQKPKETIDTYKIRDK
jgi:hypothetical protein